MSASSPISSYNLPLPIVGSIGLWEAKWLAQAQQTKLKLKQVKIRAACQMAIDAPEPIAARVGLAHLLVNFDREPAGACGGVEWVGGGAGEELSVWTNLGIGVGPGAMQEDYTCEKPQRSVPAREWKSIYDVRRRDSSGSAPTAARICS